MLGGVGGGGVGCVGVGVHVEHNMALGWDVRTVGDMGALPDTLPVFLLPDVPLAGWDVAIMPFAMNESTRFISPTKTPEYLAGGRPVVSTPIKDVMRTYGDTEIVYIADTPDAFIASVEQPLADAEDRDRLLKTADEILGDMSWDHTWALMKEKMQCAK